jgi:hypothetical protein
MEGILAAFVLGLFIGFIVSMAIKIKISGKK